uniref:Uncharacterized protein n=1 Tax=Corvus moneduloides TaxID=1196302 RepID=A0A8C3EPW3_CORMO
GAIVPGAAEVVDTNNLVRVDLHKNIPQPGDGGAASVLILGLHVEVGQLGAWPALPGEEVGAGTLEVKEEAVEGVVMWISEHHAGAALHRHALEEFGLLLQGTRGICAVFPKEKPHLEAPSSTFAALAASSSLAAISVIPLLTQLCWSESHSVISSPRSNLLPFRKSS